MNKFLIIILLLIPGFLNAQKIKKSEIIGKWKVIEGKTTSNNLSKDKSQMMTLMIDGFKESTWNFVKNGKFKIEFNKKLSPIMKEMKFLNNKLWKHNSSAKQIIIGTKEDHYNHLVLSVRQIDSGIEVYFSDTPIYLTLKKL